MRFEAKHRFFKNIPAIVPNFKNICKTCLLSFNEPVFLWHNGLGLKLTAVYLVNMVHIPGRHVLYTVPEINNNSQVFSVKWVKYCGCKCSARLTVAHSFDRENGTPV